MRREREKKKNIFALAPGIANTEQFFLRVKYTQCHIWMQTDLDDGAWVPRIPSHLNWEMEREVQKKRRRGNVDML